jgi:hypothetical protein
LVSQQPTVQVHVVEPDADERAHDVDQLELVRLQWGIGTVINGRRPVARRSDRANEV